MPNWKRVSEQLHESIRAAEDRTEYDYLDDSFKTPAMLRWEKRFNERIDVALNTSPLVCKWYSRLCTRIPVARCFYHRYGQIDARLAKAWRVICMLDNPNPKVRRLLRYMQDKKRDMDREGKRQVPLILNYQEVLVLIQTLSLVPEDLEIE